MRVWSSAQVCLIYTHYWRIGHTAAILTTETRGYQRGVLREYSCIMYMLRHIWLKKFGRTQASALEGVRERGTSGHAAAHTEAREGCRLASCRREACARQLDGGVDGVARRRPTTTSPSITLDGDANVVVSAEPLTVTGLTEHVLLGPA